MLSSLRPTSLLTMRGWGCQGFVVMDNPHDRVKVTFQKELLEVQIPIEPACCSSSSYEDNAGSAHGRCISQGMAASWRMHASRMYARSLCNLH